MKIQIETIDKERAEQLLGMNTGNFRKLDRRRVTNYAADMVNGKWEVNGETIKINGDELVDGQHRLSAVVQSGVTIESAIAYDVPVSSRHIDDGKPRRASDYLRQHGLANWNTIAGIAKYVLCHDRKRWNWNSLAGAYISRDDVFDFCIEHDDKVQQAVRLSSKIKRKKEVTLSPVLVGAVLYLGAANHEAEQSENAMWFADKLANGDDLKKHDAVYHLRERALKTTTIKAWSREHARALTAIAWNKTVRSEPVRRLLRVAATGPAAMTIPFILNEDGY